MNRRGKKLLKRQNKKKSHAARKHKKEYSLKCRMISHRHQYKYNRIPSYGEYERNQHRLFFHFQLTFRV